VLLGFAAARAGDDPFGLPVPIDKNRPGTVMLHGGGRRFSDEVRQEFVRLAGGKDVRIVLMAEQHFDARSGRIERLTGLLRDHKRLAKYLPACHPEKMIGLAVEEDTALILQANRLRVTGKKLAHVFLQGADPRSVTWHALKPGDAALLRPAREGYILELDDWEFGE
jgi:cyanophycinase-like exopeptidase